MMVFYNDSAQLGMETLYEEAWQDLQNPVDSEALNDSLLLVDLLGKYVSLVISPVLVPPSQLHSTHDDNWSYFTVDITFACHYIKEESESLKSYLWQVVFRLVAY